MTIGWSLSSSLRWIGSNGRNRTCNAHIECEISESHGINWQAKLAHPSVLYWYISEFEFWNTRDTHVYTLNRRTVCNGVATGFLSASRMIYCRHEQAPRNLRTLFPASLHPSAFDVISRNVQTVARSCNVDATKGTIRLPFMASYIRSGSWFALIIPQSW